MKRMKRVIGILLITASLLTAAAIPAGAEEDINFVPGEKFDLTVSSTIKDAVTTKRTADKLLDGNKATVWYAAWVGETQAACDEWILLTFKTPQKIASVTLTAEKGGKYFPKDFVISWSMTNEVDIPIPGQSYTDYALKTEGETTVVENEFAFEEPAVAKYLKVSVSKRSKDKSTYLLSLSELGFESTDATAEEIAAAEEADAAVERPKVVGDPKVQTAVTASSFLEPENLWGEANLSDGTISNQWSSEWVNTDSDADEIWVLMKSVDPVKFTGVILYSQSNVCFPRDFRFQYSFNDADYIDIPGATYTDYQTGDKTKQVFVFPTAQTATSVRLFITKKNADPSGNYLVQLAEIDPRGFVPTAQEITDAEKAFNVATDNMPVDPDIKPEPEPVGPDDVVAASGCGSQNRSAGIGLMSLLLFGGGLHIIMKQGGVHHA